MLGWAVLLFTIGVVAPAYGGADSAPALLSVAAIMFAVWLAAGVALSFLDRHGEIDRRILRHA